MSIKQRQEACRQAINAAMAMIAAFEKAEASDLKDGRSDVSWSAYKGQAIGMKDSLDRMYKAATRV